MKIVFNKFSLLEKLSPAMGTVSTKNTIPAIEGVLIETLENNEVRISTYDMSKGIRSIVKDTTVIEGGSYILNASRFIQYVKAMPNEEFTLEIDGGLNVKIYSGKSSFSMFAFKGSDFPMLPELLGEKGFSVSSTVLKKMISKVIHSVAVAETRPMLCGAFFKIIGNKIEVVSCDSFTLSKCSIVSDLENIGEIKVEKLSFIIPGHALNEIIKILPDKEEKVNIYIARKIAIFHVGELTFFTRMIDSEYIDYEKIIPREQTIFLTVNRERLLDGLERAGLIAEEKVQGSGKSHVKVVVSGDMLSLTSSSVNGKVYDEMHCTHEGEDIEIGFNCRYLINSVRAADSDEINVTMKSAKQSITIEPTEKKEESDFFYMILPVRMNE